MSEPKACPCGGQVYVGELKFTGETQWCVGCLHCNRGSGKHTEKGAAVAAWNAYVVSVDGKAQRPEESAQREARSEHIPTPEGRGGERNAALEEAKDVLRLYQEYKAARPAGAKAEAWDRYADAAALYGDVMALALLSSPRVEEDAKLRAAAKMALHEMRHTIAPRNSFTDAVDALDAALSPPVG